MRNFIKKEYSVDEHVTAIPPSPPQHIVVPVGEIIFASRILIKARLVNDIAKLYPLTVTFPNAARSDYSKHVEVVLERPSRLYTYR